MSEGAPPHGALSAEPPPGAGGLVGRRLVRGAPVPLKPCPCPPRPPSAE
ncbi:MAG: hypothetical protein ACXQTZ_03645 [Candidatus Alkanophagales archaeon]